MPAQHGGLQLCRLMRPLVCHHTIPPCSERGGYGDRGGGYGGGCALLPRLNPPAAALDIAAALPAAALPHCMASRASLLPPPLSLCARSAMFVNLSQAPRLASPDISSPADSPPALPVPVLAATVAAPGASAVAAGRLGRRRTPSLRGVQRNEFALCCVTRLVAWLAGCWQQEAEQQGAERGEQALSPAALTTCSTI